MTALPYSMLYDASDRIPCKGAKISGPWQLQRLSVSKKRPEIQVLIQIYHYMELDRSLSSFISRWLPFCRFRCSLQVRLGLQSAGAITLKEKSAN